MSTTAMNSDCKKISQTPKLINLKQSLLKHPINDSTKKTGAEI